MTDKSSSFSPSTESASLRKALSHCLIEDRYSLKKQLAAAGRLASGAKQAARFEQIQKRIHTSQALVRQREASCSQIHYPDALPISGRVEEIAALIQSQPVVIVAGETGSGKSTQLPKICLQAGRGRYGQIAHTQPRRIAARAIAGRLSEELGVPLGAGVGYRVRFSQKTSEQDRVCVLTDGMLLAEAERDRFLNRYDTLIIDEAHERSLNIDFVLGLIKRLLRKRDDLKVVITSATIDTARFSDYFDGAPVVEVSGRSYPVEIRYQPLDASGARSDRALHDGIWQAIDSLFAEQPGHTLVFLPGERDIHEAIKSVSRRIKPGIELLPLYARLPSKAQAALFKPGGQTRIIFSTNVAETSLTLPGVEYVIDSGLARVNRYNPGRGVNRLQIERISQAAANQRAGRCGRVKDGVCVRLYDEEDFAARPAFTTPEILRTSLSGVVLTMKAHALGDVRTFPFIEAPERKQINAAFRALSLLGALDSEHALTPLGKQLARLPVDPRIGRILLAGVQEYDCAESITVLAALLEVPDPRLAPHNQQQAARQRHDQLVEEDDGATHSDFALLLALWARIHAEQKAKSRKDFVEWCERHFLSHYRIREWQALVAQLGEHIRAAQLKQRAVERKQAPNKAESAGGDAVARALLSGFLENIAMAGEKGIYNGTQGKQLAIFPGSVLAKQSPKWVVAAELVDTSRLYARLVAPIKVEWLEQQAGDFLKRAYSEPHWVQKEGQVVAFERASFMGLPVYHGRKKPYGEIDPAECRAIFIRDALLTGAINRPPGFLKANLALHADIERMEHKLRRHDVLVDDRRIFAFYDKQLPETVISEASLAAWLQSASKATQAALHISRAYLMEHDARAADAWPDQLTLKHATLKLAYYFKPGDERDGITATLPISLINQVEEDEVERAIPGQLREKLELLLRGLPKSVRRAVQPIPETVEQLLPAVLGDTRPVYGVLAEYLSRKSGQEISVAMLRKVVLPAHLRINYQVVDVEDDTIAEARDFTALKREWSEIGSTEFAKTLVAEVDIEREGITRWDFGDLPEVVTVPLSASGEAACAYPALVDTGDSVAIRVFDLPDEADAYHQQGVVRLILLSLPAARQWQKQPLPYWHSISLRYAPIGEVSALRVEIIERVVRTLASAVCPDSRTIERCASGRSVCAAVLTQAEFEVAAEVVEAGFRQQCEALCAQLDRVLEAYQSVRRDLDHLAPALQASSQEDMEGQLGFLLYEGFLQEIPQESLERLPAYLKGLKTRLARAAHDPAGEARKLEQVSGWWQAYLSHWEAHPHSSELEAYRWLVEAYRLNVFAPQIRVGMKASPQRLQAAWQQFQEKVSAE